MPFRCHYPRVKPLWTPQAHANLHSLTWLRGRQASYMIIFIYPMLAQFSSAVNHSAAPPTPEMQEFNTWPSPCGGAADWSIFKKHYWRVLKLSLWMLLDNREKHLMLLPSGNVYYLRFKMKYKVALFFFLLVLRSAAASSGSAPNCCSPCVSA